MAGQEPAPKRACYSSSADVAAARPWDLLLRNCRVATMSATFKDVPYGMLADGEPVCAIAVKDGQIVWVGRQEELPGGTGGNGEQPAVEIYDAAGRWVTPGLVDCHTHVVYGGDRAGEWELKLKGATYEEVAKAGGGIVNTVDGTRRASVEELVDMAKPRIEALLREGVTTMDIKSGYGLNLEAERKMLQAARQLSKHFGIGSTATYLGAHAVPREYKGRADEYIDTVVADLDVLHREGLVDSVDAFCETIGFTEEQTSRVFTRARELGIPVRLHGDQLHDLGGGALAARFGGLSCDHCEYTSDTSIAAMAKAGTIAVLLPTSNYFVKEKKYPPIAGFRKAGIPMALGTNCNPGSSPCCSILLCLNMACTLFGLTPEEALYGVTRHGAAAMGLSETRGTIEAGKIADLAVWDVGNLCELAYNLGLNRLKRCYRAGKAAL